jgi:hypothetical protein
MKFEEKYDVIFSLGGNCCVAHNLRVRGLRQVSLPFDWCYMKTTRPIEYLCEGFKNNFQDFLLKENLVPLTGEEYNNSHTNKAQYKDIHTGYYWVNHFPLGKDLSESYVEVYTKIRRRLDRLLSLIENGQHILCLFSPPLHV